MKKFYLLTIVLSSFITYSQVGINTTEPTNSLDINGDLRVRNTTPSNNTGDIPLVIDSEGVIKKKLNNIQGNFRGVLFANYDSRLAGNVPNANNIYHINTIAQIVDSGNDFDNATDTFVAPVTGIYEVTITLTIKGFSTTLSNYVTGLFNDTTGAWIMRFSMDKAVIDSAGVAGETRTFTGIAQLTAGSSYKFGYATGDFILIAVPNGASGTGLGSYFRIQLIDN